MNSTVTFICDWYRLYCRFVIVSHPHGTCPADPDMVMEDKQPAKRPKRDDAQETSLTYHFQLRDRQLHQNLLALHMSDTPSVSAIHLPTELIEEIVKRTHCQEHRNRTAPVFKKMDSLPKCKTCDSVS